jgi:predicted nuclease of restriction endonuclease-like (RecB) superfamily
MNYLDLNFNEIIKMIEKRRENAYRKVNEEIVSLYWEIGEYLSNQVENSSYGESIIKKMANFIKQNHPTLKGFTQPNLYRMKQFYETYNKNEKFSPLVRKLSWTNNLLILSGAKSIEEKEFYLKLSIKNNYSKRKLDRQISTGYFERYMLGDGEVAENLEATVDEDDYPNTRILDTYTLEFLDLPNHYTERNLQKSIIKNLKDFILEIGKDFTFINEEYKVQVGNHDFFIDLLFYNGELACLVAFELKIGEFKAEHLGKMNLYLEALDRDVRKKNENPSVGIILCTSKDEKVVEYAMNKNMSQAMVSNYTLKLIDKKLLESKLKQFTAIVEDNNTEE